MRIAFTEEEWRNSQFSIARFYGGCVINGKGYTIVNKEGVTLMELSNPESPHYVGDDNMAIQPGEPADLVRNDCLAKYKELGRDEFWSQTKGWKR